MARDSCRILAAVHQIIEVALAIGFFGVLVSGIRRAEWLVQRRIFEGELSGGEGIRAVDLPAIIGIMASFVRLFGAHVNFGIRNFRKDESVFGVGDHNNLSDEIVKLHNSSFHKTGDQQMFKVW